jgi:response regulator RpfG family c-di-GMP phosphodiesterase
MEAIRIAGWLHDIGKITTPVWIMDKATKLETLMDRLELVELRFRLIRELLRRQAGAPPDPAEDAGLAARLAELDGALDAVRRANVPAENADPALLARVQEISRRTYTDDGAERPFLTPAETENLSVRRGTLTEAERRIMQTHVDWTIRLLAHIPFKGHLAGVPTYAGQHHERLNGRGYPDGAERDRIPIQSRILAIADFYEALSAKDRPYRRPMTKEEIIAIMRESAVRQEIDGDVLEVMIRSDLIDEFEALFDGLRQEGLSAYTAPPL